MVKFLAKHYKLARSIDQILYMYHVVAWVKRWLQPLLDGFRRGRSGFTTVTATTTTTHIKITVPAELGGGTKRRPKTMNPPTHEASFSMILLKVMKSLQLPTART